MIINNSSVAGLRGMARLSHYAASKWGLVGLTKSWAIELAPYNIRVVALCPTGVNTPMNDGLAMLEGKTPARSPSAPPATCWPCPGSSPRTSPPPSSSWPRQSPRDHRLGVHPRRRPALALRTCGDAENAGI